MPFIARIPKWFSARRAAQVTAFFADKEGGSINVLRATKLIYLSDRASMAEREYPVTGDNFVAMPFGPVNTYTYSLMNGEAEPPQTHIWAEFIGPRANYRVPLARPITIDDLDELSRSDIRILEATWNAFKDIEKYELAEWTHRFCPEWRDPAGSSVPIDFATVFKRLDKAEPIELAEQLQAERVLVASFAA
ncbi:Panacea domain-containing protein [Caulobacter sp. DWP3-1-3b2]|uniref:Panacea domain-containing protein n=1 Tax=Caulobacter sp. DWP3-1-3b2 TaxID=2804643 RepID=UPI003CE86BA0